MFTDVDEKYGYTGNDLAILTAFITPMRYVTMTSLRKPLTYMPAPQA